MKKIIGNIVDIFQKSIFPGEIIVEDGKIASIRKTSLAGDQFILPGFIDAHVHIESSMLLPSRFARECIRHGTLALVSDPHEIANVLGLEGIHYMIEDSRKVPVHFYFGAPSCVPATRLETSGAEIGVVEIEALLEREDIHFLAEMMNFPGVIYGDEQVKQKLEISRKYKKPVDGHAPGLSGKDLLTYVGNGISTDHEASELSEGREKIQAGMKILIREGSAARNFDRLIPLLKDFPESVMFCTDDLHPDDLIQGHINKLVARSIALGYDLFDVLRAASLNPKNHYGLKIGMLQEGDPADFIVVNDLVHFQVESAYIQGEPAFSEGKVRFTDPPARPLNHFMERKIELSDIEFPSGEGKMIALEAIDGELFTRKILVDPAVREGKVVSSVENDLLKMVLINRYRSMPPAVAFVRGFGLKDGAFGSSISHDSHNILIVGVDDKDILDVARLIIKNRGGLVVKHNKGTEMLALPVGGLISMEPAARVATAYEKLNQHLQKMGSGLRAPIMTLSFMALLVIPELKLGEKGLFDVSRFDYIPAFQGDQHEERGKNTGTA